MAKQSVAPQTINQHFTASGASKYGILQSSKKSAFSKIDGLALRMQSITLTHSNNGRGALTILKKLTLFLPHTLKKCNPNFYFEEKLNPRRVLTKPSEVAPNSKFDNSDSDLIIYVNDIFQPDGQLNGHKYQVLDLLGQGTFGQVVKCINLTTKQAVAVKVVKNKPAYYSQGLSERKILQELNRIYDAEDKGHLVRLLDSFVFRGHLCLVFELLSINLYELIKMNQHRGFSINLLRVFLKQIIEAQIIIAKSHTIHCDLKPENILLCELTSPHIKIIDFGSACKENQTIFTYIQSRFYRSPEVILGIGYSSAIDIWSIGCIAAELFFGLPLFPGHSEYNQICRIVDMFGLPPTYMLAQGKNVPKYFASTYSPNGERIYLLKTEEQYGRDTRTPVIPSKKYFAYKTLQENIEKLPTKKDLSEADRMAEYQHRKCFIHFLLGLLQLDPVLRWTADQAILHPFITEMPFSSSWTPPPSSTRPLSVPSSAAFIPYNQPRNLSSSSSGSYSSYQDPSFSPGNFQCLLGTSPSANFIPSPQTKTNYLANTRGPPENSMVSKSLPNQNNYTQGGGSYFYPQPPLPSNQKPILPPISGYQFPTMPNNTPPTANQFPTMPNNTPPTANQMKYPSSPARGGSLNLPSPSYVTPPKQQHSYRSSRSQSYFLSQNPPPAFHSYTNPPYTANPGLGTNSKNYNSSKNRNHKLSKHRKMPSTGQFPSTFSHYSQQDIYSPPDPSQYLDSSSPRYSPEGDSEGGQGWDIFYFDDVDSEQVSSPTQRPTHTSPMGKSPGNVVGRTQSGYIGPDMLSTSLGNSPHSPAMGFLHGSPNLRPTRHGSYGFNPTFDESLPSIDRSPRNSYHSGPDIPDPVNFPYRNPEEPHRGRRWK